MIKVLGVRKERLARAMSALLALCTVMMWTSGAVAQAYPVKPVTIVVGQPPGGVTDWMSRALAQQLQEKWKQSVVVENKVGAGGKIANEYVARAAQDGYTLQTVTSIVAAGMVFDKDKSLDLEKAYAPLATMLFAPYVIIVPTEAPGKNLAELFAYARANPGKLNFAAVTNTGQMLDEYALFQQAGVNITVVPYNGGAPSLRAVVANEVQGYFGAVFGMQAQIAGGRIRALAVTSAKRFSLLPDIPTVKEAIGLDFDSGVHYGFATTAGAPRDVVTKVAADILEVVRRPDMQDAVRKQGYEPLSLGPDEFGRLIIKESRKAVETARLAKIQPQ
jgi:tripartite-type tricarboxylate transporter receptor subunit TctC